MRPLLMILALITTFGITHLPSQNSFFIGANGGVNTSKFNFTEDLKELYPVTSSVIGVNGGFDMGFQFDEWTLSTGVHYIRKGGKYQTDNFNDDGSVAYFTATEKLHVISVPVLLGFREHLANKFGWSLAVGPSFNFGLTGKLDEETEYFGSDEVDRQNYKVTFGQGVNEDYRPMQVGFQLSPGLFVDLNEKSKLRFNVTWDFGTSDVFNPRYKDANEFFDLYTGNQTSRSAIFSIGYEYHFNFEDKY